MAGRTRQVLRVARHRDLRRIGAAFGVFAISEHATWIAVAVYAFTRGGVGEAGLVAVVQLTPAVMVAPFAAYAGDRFRKDRVLAVGYAVQAVAMLATATGMWRNAPAVLVYGAATAAAVAVTFTRPAMGALLPAVTTTPADLTAANVSVGVLEHLGAFVGPGLAGLLMQGAGEPARVFAAMGFGLMIAAVAVTRLHLDPGLVAPHESLAASDVVDDAFGGFRTLRRAADVRLLMVVVGVSTTLVGASDVLFVAVADDLFDEMSAGRAGLLAAAFGLGGLVAALGSVVFVGRSRLAVPLALAVAGSAAALALIGTVSQPALVLVLFMAIGAGGSVARITGTTLLQRVAPRAVLARVFGVMEGLDMAALAAGAAGVSLLVNWLGLRSALAVMGLMAALAVGMRARGLNAVDTAATPPSSAIVELLRTQAMFASLPPPTLERLLAGFFPIVVPAGTVVIRQGDSGDRYFLIERGELAVTVDGLPARTLGPGDGFGEIALVRDIPRTATVTAITPVRLQAIERAEFLTAVTGHPRGLATATDRAQALLDDDTALRRRQADAT